ncbi:MAG: PTS sugar transporter subunit IIA [Planctomycetota bacterium]|jgi:fructose-specific phosphotransferase system IIA component
MKTLPSYYIKVPLESKDKMSAIIELIDLLDSKKLLINRDEALDAVVTREKTRSTGIGSGIAIPHGKCNAVKELVMAIGITLEPIEFESIDEKPVKIVFLLVSPADKTGPHIQALAKISRLMLDDKFKQSLEDVGSEEEAYKLIDKHPD